MQHDVFICHASEDKDGLVRPLAEALRARNLAVWYDEFSLSVGDSLREAIDRGLNESRFGVVVVSPAFFAKSWTKRELSGLVAREMIDGGKVILPIWHQVGPHEVLQFSPPLADLIALNSGEGVARLCEDLVRRIRPEASPLLVAREELMRFGWKPPPITDEWWLDRVELQEQVFSPMRLRPLTFRLPYSYGAEGRERGLNIAWTTLQLDWQEDAAAINLCQMTHPEVALEFLRSNDALLEACHRDPTILANYLPQLLIPAYSAEFTEDFDNLLAASMAKIRAEPDPRFPDAVCERQLALRHPSFGGHTAREVADKWMRGWGRDLGADLHGTLDYIFWLLSDASTWMPPIARDTLTEGMRQCSYWPNDLLRREGRSGKISDEVFRTRGGPTRWTKARRAELAELIAPSAEAFDLPDTPAIIERFIDLDFVGEQRRLRASWRQK
jgi:hypothetical protein